jgi:cytochrome P450
MAADGDGGVNAAEGPADGRKTAALAAGSMSASTRARLITDFAAAREILRSPKVIQAGAGAGAMDHSQPEEVPIFYIDGEPHRRRRSVIAKYFTLKAIESRYQPIMERTADRLLADFAKEGTGRLDKIGFRFAVAVAAEIIGLDHSDLEGITRRIEATINTDEDAKRAVKNTQDEAIAAFYATDVQPAIDARRNDRRDDVISRLLDEGCSDWFIRTEVRGYAFAGMMTTREFIVMAAWYFFEQPALLERFRAADKDEQLAIVEEILRLEPIVGYLRRRVVEDIDSPLCGHIPAGATVTIDIRAANMDEAATGACPHLVDPHREKATAPGSGFMSFGDGPHRCPGAQLSLHEARTFLDRMVRLPGVRMEAKPRAVWFKPISSYELYDAVVACDKAG